MTPKPFANKQDAYLQKVLSDKLSCLQAGAFMFASRNI
jgi:hypothetical protein